jgi:PAS domain S-box-containing protein
MTRKETNRKRAVPSVLPAAVRPTRKPRSRTEERLRSILEATTEFYGTWNPSSGPIQFHDRHLAALGYSEADSSKRQVAFHNLIHADDRAAFEAELDAYLSGRTSLLHCEFRLRTKAGPHKWFEFRGKIIRRDRRGAAVEMAYSIRDIHASKEQHEEILASRDGLTAILQASRDIICVVDPKEFRFVAFNKAFEDLIFRAHKVRVRPGMRAEDIDPQQAEEWNAFYRRVLADRSVTREYKVAGLNETHHMFAKTLDRDGLVCGICVLGHDVRNGKHLEAALRRSEEKFAKAFRDTPLALAITSMQDHRYLDLNDAFAETTGYSREELLGKTPLEVGIWVHPEKRIELVRQVQAMGEVRNLEVLYRTKSGEIREALGSAAMIDIEDEPCMFAVMMDITESKRAAEALRESEEHLRFAIEAGHMYAFDWDLASDVITRSKQSTAMLGLPNGGARHTKQELIDRMLPEDKQQYARVIQSVSQEQPDYRAIFRMPLRNGHIAWLEESGRAIFGPDGKLRKVIGITADVTEIRESERTLRELSGRLITAQEEERRRIARELHDHIGQEAALICVQAQRLDSGVADEEHTTRSDVHELYRRIKTLAGDVSKLSHRLHSTELTFLGLAVAAERLCRDFAHQYGIDVDYQPKPLPPNLDSMKSLCIYRVLQETLQNVVKHSRASQVIVELRPVESELVLNVRDNGEGFDIAKASSGLGLLSMRERVNFVGGRFAIASKPGSGTKVTAHVAI